MTDGPVDGSGLDRITDAIRFLRRAVEDCCRLHADAERIIRRPQPEAEPPADAEREPTEQRE